MTPIDNNPIDINLRRKALKTKAREVFGEIKKNIPDINEGMKQATGTLDGNLVLTLAGLDEVWGLSPEQLKGLATNDIFAKNPISVGDGIDEAELDQLEKLKTDTLELFKGLLVGCGLSDDKLNELYDKLWYLAVKGELTNSSWDKLVEEYGLESLEMTGSAFEALLGGQDGFGSGKVDGIAEFVVALRNLDLTMRARGASDANRMELLKSLCKATNFNIIYMDKAEGLAKDVLKQLKPGYDVDGKTKDQIFADIKNGVFGDVLKNKTISKYEGFVKAEMNNWEEFVLGLLRDLDRNVEEAIRSNLDGDAPVEQIGKYNSRKKLLAELINEGEKADQKKRDALVAELAGIYQGKASIDFAKIEGPKEPKEADNKIDYEKKSGGLEYMRKIVEDAKAKRLKDTPELTEPPAPADEQAKGA